MEGIAQVDVYLFVLETQLRRDTGLFRGVVIIAEADVLLGSIAVLIATGNTEAEFPGQRTANGDVVALRGLIGKFGGKRSVLGGWRVVG